MTKAAHSPKRGRCRVRESYLLRGTMPAGITEAIKIAFKDQGVQVARLRRLDGHEEQRDPDESDDLRPNRSGTDKRPIDRHRLLTTTAAVLCKQVAAKRIKVAHRVRQALEAREEDFPCLPELQDLVTACPWEHPADERMRQRRGQTGDARGGVFEIGADKCSTQPRPRRYGIKIGAVKLP